MTKSKKIQLNVGLQLANGMIVPKGTKLQFGTEGYAFFRGQKVFAKYIPGLECDDAASMLPEGAVEDPDTVAATVIDLIKDKYPDGFTANQFAEDFGEQISGNIYTITDGDGDDDAVLLLKTPDEKELKIFLAKDETNTYTLTGNFDAGDIEEVTAATESFIGKIAMLTRSKHALRKMKK